VPVELRACRFAYSRRRPVFASLDLTLPDGASVLVGRNGAGKSTLLGLAASLLAPSTGSVSYHGLDPRRYRDRGRYRRLVGWMPQHIAPVPGLSVREQVAYAGWLKGSSRTEAWAKASAALERVRLSSMADRRSHELSGGQLRRLGLAQVLVHDAEVILMDEPTAGLDPLQCRGFAKLVAEVSERAHLVVSTHQLDQLDGIYATVIVLDAGTVRFQGPCEEFLRLSATAGGRCHISVALGRLVGEEE
jgi:ABC-2 type transport system ATP-binding protein